MAMRASLIIDVATRGAERLARLAAAARRLARGMDDVDEEARDADDAIDDIGDGAEGRFARIRAAARRLAGRAGIGSIEQAAERAGRAMGGMIRAGGRLAAGAASWAAAGAAFGGGLFLGGIIKTGSDFEQFQVILENTEGSAAKAKQAMDWVKEFAKTTPYEVADVMEAFVALRAFGLDPLDGTLKALGNTSAGMGKPLMQAVEMMADAATGEFERLKEFGIKASVEGDKVTIKYQRNGKEIVKTAKNNASEIRKALVGVMDERFAGMMDRQSKTLKGVWSNIKDMAGGFQLDVADAGVFDLIKTKAEGFLAKLQGLAKDGTLKRWASQIAVGLEKMIKLGSEFVENTDWAQVGRDTLSIAKAVWAIANALAKAVEWGQRLSKLKLLNPVGVAMNWLGEGYDAATRGGGKPRPRAPALPKRGPVMQPLKGGNPWGSPGRKTAQVGGQIDIRVRTDPGVTATATRMASVNPAVPLTLASRGKVATA